MAIDFSSMRHRVSLMENDGTTTSPFGEVQDVWNTIGTYWACVTSLSGRELFYSQQVDPLANLKVLMRNNGVVITTKHRLLFEGRTLEIASVIRVAEPGGGERNEAYEMLCEEKVTV